MDNPVAIVTGANRGLGLGTSQTLAQRGYHVIMLGRNIEQLNEVCHTMKEEGRHVDAIQCDLHKTHDVDKIIDQCFAQNKRIDVLVNNAGIFLDTDESLETTREQLEESFLINSIAPFLLMKKVIPYMKKLNYGRIVNISSGMGHIKDMDGGWPAYRSSKAALNVFTVVMADEVKEFNIKINVVCPGWVKTDMGGANAPRSIEEGIQGILWAATLDERGPSGGFYRDGKHIPW